MLTLPEIVARDSLTYAYIPFTVPMSALPATAEQGFPRLFDLLEEADIVPVGAAFMNYRRIDMVGTLDFEIGAPIAVADANGAGLRFGTLPGGEFGRVRWTGPYDRLMEANGVLIGWALEEGIAWDARRTLSGDEFACRLEIYETGPIDDPDPATWTTEIAIKIGNAGPRSHRPFSSSAKPRSTA